MVDQWWWWWWWWWCWGRRVRGGVEWEWGGVVLSLVVVSGETGESSVRIGLRGRREVAGRLTCSLLLALPTSNVAYFSTYPFFKLCRHDHPRRVWQDDAAAPVPFGGRHRERHGWAHQHHMHAAQEDQRHQRRAEVRYARWYAILLLCFVMLHCPCCTARHHRSRASLDPPITQRAVSHSHM